jgi:hypothetical protein
MSLCVGYERQLLARQYAVACCTNAADSKRKDQAFDIKSRRALGGPTPRENLQLRSRTASHSLKETDVLFKVKWGDAEKMAREAYLG